MRRVSWPLADPARSKVSLPRRHRRRLLPSPAPWTSPQWPRVVTAILAAVDADRPPRRLPTGTTAVTEIRAALHGQLDELETWAAAGRAVDGPPAA
jgi:hypothetical protein